METLIEILVMIIRGAFPTYSKEKCSMAARATGLSKAEAGRRGA